MKKANEGFSRFLAWRREKRLRHWADFRADPQRWAGMVAGQLNRNQVTRDLDFKHHRRLTQNTQIRRALERLERVLLARGFLKPKDVATPPETAAHYPAGSAKGDQRLIEMLQAENERLRAQLQAAQQGSLHAKCLITLGELLDD